VFQRSDTSASWDDNDFGDPSSVSIQGSCPVLVNATWPHELGWENADPAEANHETTRFTLDSYASTGDLTGKQLNLTIELNGETRGPNATAGGYLVSLVSVSTFDRVVGSGGGGGQTTEIGYTEAESASQPLFQVGDRVTMSFALPNKTKAVDSYDPARVIKINVRVYNIFSVTPVSGGKGGGGGEGGATVLFGPIGASGAGGANGAAGDESTGGTSGTSGTSGTGEAGGGGEGPAGGGEGPGGGGEGGAGGELPAPVFDYLTSQFAISNFTVTDASTQ
jgi:hypothetical protein